MKKLLLCLMATSSLYAAQVEVHNICGIAQSNTIKITNPLDQDVFIRLALMLPSDTTTSGISRDVLLENNKKFLALNEPGAIIPPMHGSMTLCEHTNGDASMSEPTHLLMMSSSYTCPAGGSRLEYLLPSKYAFGYILGFAYIKQKNADESIRERAFGWTSLIDDGGMVHVTLTYNRAQTEPITQIPYVIQRNIAEAYKSYKDCFMRDKETVSWLEFITDFTSQQAGVTSDKRAEKVILNITTDAFNIDSLWLQIERLMRQSEKPDQIILNLLEDEFPSKVLPCSIREQMKRGLTINWHQRSADESVGTLLRRVSQHIQSKRLVPSAWNSIESQIMKSSDFGEDTEKWRDNFCLIENRPGSSGRYEWIGSAYLKSKGVHHAGANIHHKRLNQMLSYLNKHHYRHMSVSFGLLLGEASYRLVGDSPYADHLNKYLPGLLSQYCVLTPCMHNHFPWTKDLLMIPDYFVIGDQRGKVDELLDWPDQPFLPFSGRKNKVFFSGSISGNPKQYTLENKHKVSRIALLSMADAYPEIINYNVRDTYHITRDPLTTTEEVADWYRKHHANKEKAPSNYYDHAEYKYVLSLDGFGAAWGRVPALLATGSVLLMQSDCKQWFYSGLIPDEHYVLIKSDLSNLIEVFRDLESNPEKAERIALNGKEFARRYLTNQKVDQYFSGVIDEILVKSKIPLKYEFNSRYLVYTYALNYFNVDRNMISEFLKRVNREFIISSAKIQEASVDPMDMHRLWITENTEIPEEFLTYFESSLQFYQRDHVHFWCLDPDNIPQSIARLNGLGIQIHSLQEHLPTFKTKSLINKLLKDKLFGFASNLIRLEVLNKFGGVYSDTGLLQKKDIKHVASHFDTVFYVKETGELDVRAFYSKNGSKFMDGFLNFIVTLPQILPEKRVLSGALPVQGITTSYGIMAYLPQFNIDNPYERIGFVSEGEEFEYHGQMLWIKSSIQKVVRKDPAYFYNW